MALNWEQTPVGNGVWDPVTSPWGYFASHAFDINGDGYQDLVIVEGLFPDFPGQAMPADTDFPMHIMINDGNGTYTDQTSTYINGPIPETTHVGVIIFDDFNGDGRPDILIGDNGWDGDEQPGADNVLLLSNSDGMYDDASDQLGGHVRVTYTIAAADVDGDGDIDIYDQAIGPYDDVNNTIATPMLLLNDGSGNFTDATDHLPGMVTGTNMLGGIEYLDHVYYISALADLNGDGAAELIVGQQHGMDPGNPIVFWNDGSGNFSDDNKTLLPIPTWGMNSEYADIKVFDANGDGHMDILTIAYDGTFATSAFEMSLFLGDGSGGFTEISDTAFPLGDVFVTPSLAQFVDLVDIEGDGDIDIVMPPSGVFNSSDRPVVWLNDGTGSFSETLLWSDFTAQVPRFSGVVLSPDGNGYNFYWIGTDPNNGNQGWYNTFWATLDETTSRRMDGDDGFDQIIGGKASELIRGFGWSDQLFGNGGKDTILGGDGNDSILGGGGNDLIRGGAGPDTLDGGANGAAGDTLSYKGSAKRVAVDLSRDIAYRGDAKGDVIRNFENVTGSDHDDVLTGDAGRNVLIGRAGADTLNGKAGHDLLQGGDQNDRLIGDRGRDTLDGGAGNDTLNGGAGTDQISGGKGKDLLNGGDAKDTLNGDGGNDTLNGQQGQDILAGGNGRDSLSGGTENDSLDGGAGQDTLKGGDGDDSLRGGSQADTLSGEKGRDTLIGNGGNDLLKGGGQGDLLRGNSGKDTLNGGAGNDTLNGGSGADTFLFNGDTNTGHDQITDFQNGTDVIEISGAVGFGDLTITQGGGNTVISWSGGSVTLLGETGTINEDDFMFT